MSNHQIDFDIKEDHHLYKFKNRSKGKTNNPHYHIGNATSSSHSRPSGGLNLNRLNEKIINNDTEQHQVIDHHLIMVPHIYRKSTIQTIISNRKKTSTNPQTYSIQKNKNKNKKEKIPRIVNLKMIANNISIGNLECLSESFLLKKKINVIINVSKNVLCRHRQRKIQNIFYKDTKTLSYQPLDQAAEIIDQNEKKNVLIMCNQGVNRSVSIAIGYAILRKKLTFDQTYQYVESMKSKKYESWNSLTNPRIKNILKALSGELNKN
jgi:protein-tyrosine phosphatase